MEHSDAGSWLMNFEMNYSSFFLQDFELFGEPAASPMLPDFTSISPECCFSNSNSDQIQSLDVPNTSEPPESNSSKVASDEGNKKKKKKSTSKKTNGTSKQGSGKADGTDNSNVSSKASRGKKRNHDSVTHEDDREKNSTSSDEPAIQPEPHRKGHVIAERKRRQKLTQQFIALSSLVPGLTRMDKASVLGDAIKYLKQLQDQVKTLETEAAQKTVPAAAVTVRTSQSPTDECNSSIGVYNTPDSDSSTKIKVVISEQIVLIMIHFESQHGVLVKALSEIESLGLTIVSTSVVPLTNSTFHMTITAKPVEKHALGVEDLTKRLNFALRQF